MENQGERLKFAIMKQLASVRKFERKLNEEAPNLRGTSRQTLYRYFSGESEPGPGLIEAAASVLGVRVEWLAHGAGGMTTEEEEWRLAAQREAERAIEGDTSITGATMGGYWADEEFRLLLDKAFGGRVPPLARATLAHQWRRIVRSAGPGRDPADLLLRLGQAVTAPLATLGVSWAGLDESRKVDYVLAVAPRVAYEWEHHLVRIEVEALAKGLAEARENSEDGHE